MIATKIFKNGGSQAVRIPKQFRFDTDTVYIKQTAMGLLLTSKPENYWQAWLTQLRKHSWDVEVEEIEDTELMERDWDDLFT